MSRLLLTLTFLVLVATPVSAQERGLQPTDFYNELTIQSVAMAPNGELVAFTGPSMRGKNKRHRKIWLQQLNDGQPAGGPFRFTDPTEESSNPRWSPDGQWIAHTKRPDQLDEDGKPKEKEDREGWIAPDAFSNTIDAKRFDGRVITSIRYERDGTLTFLPHRSVQNKLQLFVVPTSGGEVKQVTDLLYDVNGPVWTQDASSYFPHTPIPVS